MKKIYQLALLALIMMPFSACKKQLETNPLSKFSSTSFWTSETNAMLALTALYRGNIYTNAAQYNASDWWSYQGLVTLDLASDNAFCRTGDGDFRNQLVDGKMTSNSSILSTLWNSSYSRIAQCNDFLVNVGKISMDDNIKKRFIAEARFLRASQYFYMSQFWKSVPLVTKTLTPEEANNVTKASHQDLVNFVIKEFQEAAADLPRDKDIPKAEIGRVSKQAALSFLGRTQLGEHLYPDAANTYKTIIDFNDNIIDPNYSSIFLETNENSKENIFSIQFLPNVLANALIKHIIPLVGGGYITMNPTADLMESYQFTDGTSFSYTDPRYNPEDISKDRDPRLRYTILYPNAPYGNTRYVSSPDSTASKYLDRIGLTRASQTGYAMKKYIDDTFTGSLTSGYGGNMVVIRYAEVLLSYLEAKLEAGQAIDKALLDATINKVRSRQTVNMPAINVTDPALLRPILRNERRVEMALEGVRYWDLLRWGIADQKLNADIYGAPYPNAKKPIKAKPGSPVDTYKRWYVSRRNFRKGVDETWFIPQSEININPNLQ